MNTDILLTPDEIDDFEERAAIMQYCGGLSRVAAEYQAKQIILEKRRLREMKNEQLDIFNASKNDKS